MPDDWTRNLTPSPLELREFAERMEYQALSKDRKIAHGLDVLLTDCRHRHQHGGMVTLEIVKRLEALRKLLEEVM